MGAIFVRLGDGFPLTEPQFWMHGLHPNQPATDLFQHRGDHSPAL